MSSSVVKFIHNNKIMEIQDVDPNETLLNYIREKLNKTGTKEDVLKVVVEPVLLFLVALKIIKFFIKLLMLV